MANTSERGKLQEINNPEQFDPAPKITVLGKINANWAVRLHWKPGMHPVSNGRLKFLRDDLGCEVIDIPEDYIF